MESPPPSALTGLTGNK